MFNALSSRLQTLSSDVRGLTATHWEMLKQEISGTTRLTKQQIILLVVGAVAALTGLVLLLTSLTLFLAQVFYALADWDPLLATAVSAVILALLFVIGGAILCVRSGAKLSDQHFAPVNTLRSFGQSLQSLAAPAIPAPEAFIPPPAAPAFEVKPPPGFQYQPNTSEPMNTRQNFESAARNVAGNVDDSVQRVRRNLGDTLYSLSQKIEINPLAAAAVDWLSTFLDQRGGRHTGNSFSGGASASGRPLPLSPAALGLAGIGYLLWQQFNRPAARQAASEFVDQGRQRAGEYAGRAAQTYQDSAESVSSAARRAREAALHARENVNETAHRWADTARSAAATARDAGTQAADRARGIYDDARHAAEEGVEYVSDTAHRIREKAEDGYERARDFAREQPAAAAAAGALAVGLAALLVRNASRR